MICEPNQRRSDERIAAFTSLLRMESGVLLCCFQAGPAKHAPNSTVRICRSQDEGRSWELLDWKFITRWRGVTGSIATAELVEVESGRLLLIATWFDRSDPARPLFDPTTQGILPSRQLKAFSEDNGSTWTEWEEIATPGLSGCSGTGPILKWTDGTIAYPFESFKDFHDLRPGRHGAWLVVSRDHGRTFEEPVLIAQCPKGEVYYWDQRLCPGRHPGELIGLFWTHDLRQKVDLPVHACRGTLNNWRSADVELWETSIHGQIAAPLLLDDGRWLAFVVRRSRPATLTLWESADDGRSWPASNSLVIYSHDEKAMLSQGAENIDFAQYWEDMGKWTFGHPVLRSVENGQFLLAYYAGTPDATSIHWLRLGPVENSVLPGSDSDRRARGERINVVKDI